MSGPAGRRRGSAAHRALPSLPAAPQAVFWVYRVYTYTAPSWMVKLEYASAAFIFLKVALSMVRHEFQPSAMFRKDVVTARASRALIWLAGEARVASEERS